MALDRLIIHWRQTEIRWLLLDEFDHPIAEASGDLTDLNRGLEGLDPPKRVDVFWSADQVLLKTIEVPPKPTKSILEAVPYLVEESLASDVFDCFIAIGPREGNLLCVAVIAQDLLSDCLAQLNQIGIDPEFVGIDLDFLSQEENLMLLDDRCGLIALNSATRFSLSAEHTKAQLDLLVGAEGPNFQVHYYGSADIAALISAELLARCNVEQGVQSSLLAWLASQSKTQRINLRQGEFLRQERNSASRNSLKRLASAAGWVLGLALLSAGSQGLYLASQASELEVKARALYSEVYPNDRNPRDLSRRWRSRLMSAGQQVGPNAGEWLNVISQPISQSGLQLNNLNYNASRGDLVLQLSGQRSDQIMGLAKSLIELGYSAEIGTISQERSEVRGSLRVQLEPSL
jgi:general secretion pathway protein L